MDFKNDFGRFIRDIAVLADEDEWLLNVGQQIKITNYKPNQKGFDEIYFEVKPLNDTLMKKNLKEQL